MGGAGNLGLELSQRRMEQAHATWEQRLQKFKMAVQQLAGSNSVKNLEE
jgi:hypothetical protein